MIKPAVGSNRDLKDHDGRGSNVTVTAFSALLLRRPTWSPGPSFKFKFKVQARSPAACLAVSSEGPSPASDSYSG
eukprot:875560-Rhodomonas_salina.2